MTLKEMRQSKGLTQKAAAEYLGVSLRTYQNYESHTDDKKRFQKEYMIDRLSKYGFIDENNGILTLKSIKEICSEVFDCYDVSYCFLFGSYAKGKAKGDSDVDLLINTSVNGLSFFGLIEELRDRLKKKVDLLDFRQLKDNPELTDEILKDGIKIYG